MEKKQQNLEPEMSTSQATRGEWEPLTLSDEGTGQWTMEDIAAYLKSIGRLTNREDKTN